MAVATATETAMTAPEARTMWLTAGMMDALNGEVEAGGCTVRKAGREVGREERRGKESETTADATPSAVMEKGENCTTVWDKRVQKDSR